MDVKVRKLEVIYNHPRRVFWAGTKVRGNVVLHLNQPTHVKCIAMRLHGASLITWTKTGRGNPYYKPSETFQDIEKYFDERITLFGSRDDNDHGAYLAAGMNTFGFELALSEFLPSTFMGELGGVEYLCAVAVRYENSSGQVDEVTNPIEDAFFNVIGISDLNMQPSQIRMTAQSEGTTEAGCMCIGSGTISCVFRINKLGFVPGEPVIIYAEIHNDSDSRINFTELSLVQLVIFKASTTSNSAFASTLPKSRELSFTMASKGKGAISSGEFKRWNDVPFEIPPVPPSGLPGCRGIDIQYRLEFSVVAKCDTVLRLRQDILVGTVPLQHDVEAGRVPPAPTSYEQSAALHDAQYAQRVPGGGAPLYPCYRLSGGAAVAAATPVVVTNLYHQQPAAAVVMHSQTVNHQHANHVPQADTTL